MSGQTARDLNSQTEVTRSDLEPFKYETGVQPFNCKAKKD
jgi:hypothetical protein